jgi:hypothetical protein
MNMICNAQTISNVRFIYPLLLLLALLSSSCAGPTIQSDYRPDTEFAQLKTYSWRKVSSTVPTLEQQYLRQLADQQLAAQGFIYAENNADMLFDLTLLTQTSTGSSTGIGMSIGLPIGNSGSIGLGGGKSVPRQKEEGVLLLDITRRADNSLIWRGTAEEIPLKHLSLQQTEKLTAIMEKLFAQFPPQKQ